MALEMVGTRNSEDIVVKNGYNVANYIEQNV